MLFMFFCLKLRPFFADIHSHYFLLENCSTRHKNPRRKPVWCHNCCPFVSHRMWRRLQSAYCLHFICSGLRPDFYFYPCIKNVHTGTVGEIVEILRALVTLGPGVAGLAGAVARTGGIAHLIDGAVVVAFAGPATGIVKVAVVATVAVGSGEIGLALADARAFRAVPGRKTCITSTN